MRSVVNDLDYWQSERKKTNNKKVFIASSQSVKLTLQMSCLVYCDLNPHIERARTKKDLRNDISN